MGAIYGHKVTSDTDDFVQRTEHSLRSLAQTGIPGAFLVDSYPFLKHVPDWMPGAGWKRRALEERQTTLRLIREPFEAAKVGMVRLSSLYYFVH